MCLVSDYFCRHYPNSDESLTFSTRKLVVSIVFGS